jgi:hypothetical protein
MLEISFVIRSLIIIRDQIMNNCNKEIQWPHGKIVAIQTSNLNIAATWVQTLSRTSLRFHEKETLCSLSAG